MKFKEGDKILLPKGLRFHYYQAVYRVEDFEVLKEDTTIWVQELDDRKFLARPYDMNTIIRMDGCMIIEEREYLEKTRARKLKKLDLD